MPPPLRRLISLWILLLVALLLSQQFSPRLTYALSGAVGFMSMVVAVLLLGLAVLRLRAALHRWRAARRTQQAENE